jgi:glycosyltransferase involved in cell wall biosynthesis
VHVLMEAFDRLARERKGLRLDLVGKVGMLPFELLALLLNDDEVLPGLREFYGRTTLEWVAKEVLGQRRSYRDALLARLSPESAARARFLGTISLPELIRLYQDVDLLVLPSIWHESYGLPVAEAMASGVPVVASRCGGLPELVDHGVTGWLVPRADVDSLVTTLGDLLDDPRKLSAMGRAARIRAENHLTWRQSAERLERVYLDLVAALESDVMHAADGSSRSRPRAKPLGAGAPESRAADLEPTAGARWRPCRSPQVADPPG